MRDQAVRFAQTRWLFNHQNNSLFDLEQTTSSAALRKGTIFLLPQTLLLC
jgi:hypothetical protein